MSDMSLSGLIALTRFGYGPRGDGDVQIAALDPLGFVRAELDQPGIALLSGPTLPDIASAIRQFFADRDVRRAERAAAPVAGSSPPKPEGAPGAASARPSDMSNPAGMSEAADASKIADGAAMMSSSASKPPPPQKAPATEQIVFRDEALARVRRAIEARLGFAERLVAFWSNHFCVSAAKDGLARITAGAFEREAIRPHVLGTFSDMVLAVESHPAMLHYLDNAQSVGPNSRAGQRGRRGLNENLGREIMELHTLGVGSGYSQADVTALAKILTGWSFVGAQGRRGPPGTFVFDENAHEPGPIKLLGRNYPDDGFEQGRAALLDIARHPETARFIARKLAVAFVADKPAPSLVDKLAHVFSSSNGDLRALSLALVDAPEAWTSARTRMRTPYELLIATSRLLGQMPERVEPILQTLTWMGMGLWAPPGPNGFASEAAAWATAEGMKIRLDYSALVARRLKDPPNPSALLDAMCGGASSAATRQAVARAESREQGLAILLMSPELQRS